MSYNLKNKSVVLFAVTLAMLTMSGGVAYSADQAVANNPNVDNSSIMESDDVLGDLGIEEDASNAPAQNADQAVTATDEELFGLDEEAPEVAPQNTKAENPVATAENPVATADNVSDNVDDGALLTPPEKISDNANPDDLTADPIQIEEPKSPFEKYGNAILSKVDNDLFNQMSNIEKQTTLLNLELRREQVQNQIDALRAQREKASREEQQRILEEEQKIKDNEARRKAELLEAEARVKEKEIELEKVKQAKVLNEYMNEMLIINQQWVENNAILTKRVETLLKEKTAIVEDFNSKMANLKQQVIGLESLANEAEKIHRAQIDSLNKQITKLRQSLVDNENTMKQMQSGDLNNPFANGLDPNAIDMSKEYAIMDITGKGDNIVAKIVSTDGTTFIVRKGSVLKGGEVVSSISDNYIAFDKHGITSYLYTGGTVMQYEPTKSFNDAAKTPEKAEAVKTNQQAIRNVRGVSAPSGSNLKSNLNNNNNNETNLSKPVQQNNKTQVRRSTGNAGLASFSQGMMVK